jgi:transcription elongation factor Elf1
MKIEYVVAEDKHEAKKATLTYGEMKKVYDKYYHQLNCGHYVPEKMLKIKYDHENVICPKCEKATFATGIAMNVSDKNNMLK